MRQSWGKSIMPVSGSIAVQTLRTTQRRISHDPMMPRLWQTVRDEWQRRTDRAIARSVEALDHAGVSEDYRMACRGNYR
jgi:hypothetical protein